MEYPRRRAGSFSSSLPLSNKHAELGITPLLREYIRMLCEHPDTWKSFPLPSIETNLRKSASASPSPTRLSHGHTTSTLPSTSDPTTLQTHSLTAIENQLSGLSPSN